MKSKSRVQPKDIPSDPIAEFRGDFKNYLFGKSIYPPGGRYGPRVQKFFQLVVLTQGSLRVTVGKKTYDLNPGEAILQHPNIREFYRFSPDSRTIHTWCEVTPQLFSAEDRRFLMSTQGVHRVPASIPLLIEEGLASPDELHPSVAVLARSCLLRFAAEANSPDPVEPPIPVHPALQRSLETAVSDFARLHSTEDLAKRVGISVSGLRLLFRRAGKETPSSMIWRLKAERAIQLIRSTGLTLGEIAEECGYANPFHLSRSVRRHSGKSPRHLRQAEWRG